MVNDSFGPLAQSDVPDSTGLCDNLVPHTAQRPQRFGNPFWVVGTLAGLIATVAAAVGFGAWCAQDNAITWPAIEASVPASYPPYHALIGDSLAVTLITMTTMTTYVLLRQLISTRAHGWALALWLGLSVGAGLAVGLRTSLVLAMPFIVSAIVAVGVLVNKGNSSKDDDRDAERQQQMAAAVPG